MTRRDACRGRSMCRSRKVHEALSRGLAARGYIALIGRGHRGMTATIGGSHGALRGENRRSRSVTFHGAVAMYMVAQSVLSLPPCLAPSCHKCARSMGGRRPARDPRCGVQRRRVAPPLLHPRGRGATRLRASAVGAVVGQCARGLVLALSGRLAARGAIIPGPKRSIDRPPGRFDLGFGPHLSFVHYICALQPRIARGVLFAQTYTHHDKHDPPSTTGESN